MEGIIFIGIPGSGKSSFYKTYFYDTHLRLNLDMLKTRDREKSLLLACLATRTKVVIDNTNPTKLDRQRYIPLFKACGYRIYGYYFESQPAACLARNKKRAKPVPERGVLAVFHRLELPAPAEGFDELHYVNISLDRFVVTDWQAAD